MAYRAPPETGSGRGPTNVTSSVASGSVSISWIPIECIKHNGLITDYEAELQSVEGVLSPGVVIGESFTASGLTPSTNYSFRVSGMNSNGTGPFSTTIYFMTADTNMIARLSAESALLRTQVSLLTVECRPAIVFPDP